MKLESDLVREILLRLEADEGDPRALKDIEVPDFTTQQVAYHIEKLFEAGLVEAHDLSTMSGYDWRATALTYEGHEFLNTIRDSKIWKTAKTIASQAGVFTLRALMESAKAAAKQKLLEHGVHIP